MSLDQHQLADFYLASAAKDHAAANGEALDNVRRKHLTSAAAWESLARLSRLTTASRQARLVQQDG